jgi:hypothetical protein
MESIAPADWTAAGFVLARLVALVLLVFAIWRAMRHSRS